MFIPASKLASFKAELAKLNKKLAKYDSSVEIISIVPAKEYVNFIDGCVYSSLERVDTNIMGSKYAVISGFECQLSEPAVKGKQDVEYLGMVEFIDGIPQIFASKDNLIDVINIKQIDACDHCNTVRARNKYFFFRENGQIRKIGSTCVHEWFGFNIDAIFSAYQNFMNFTAEFDPEKAGFQQAMQDCNYTPLNLVIKSVAEVTNGFTKSWEKEVTARHAFAFSQSNEKGKHSVDAEAIKKDIEQMWNIAPTTDFEFNIVSALFTDGQLHDEIANKHLGVVCWAIWNAMTTIKKVNNNIPSEYLGEVGDKIEFTATPKCVFSGEGYYGITYIYIFETDKGVAKWTTSKAIDVEKESTFKGTIKETTEYNGQKQTVVTRCKEVE